MGQVQRVADQTLSAIDDKQRVEDQALPFRSGPPLPAVAILIPVLKRPHRVEPVIDSITAATPSDHSILFIADPDDFDEHAAVTDWMLHHDEDERVSLVTLAGNYAEKINFGVEMTDEPLIFTGADDLEFHPDWLPIAAAVMNSSTQVVGTNDLCNQWVIEGRHATHSLVARSYAERGTVDEPGKLLHEGYDHEYVDNEFCETAEARGAIAYCRNSVVEHLHPMVNKAPMDELYAGMRERMASGLKVFDERRHLWQR